MSKKKKTGKVSVACIVIIAAAVLVLAGYYLLNNGGSVLMGRRASQSSSEVKKLREKDLELEYPSTPTEVVKLYWRLNRCMYNNSLKQEEQEALLKQLRILYDEELLAEEGNSWDAMLANFEKDAKTFRKEKRTISTYTVDPENSVQYAELEGKECATLTATVMEMAKSKSTRAYAKFMCRKDDDGKWKIVGWEQTDAQAGSAGE